MNLFNHIFARMRRYSEEIAEAIRRMAEREQK